ncbi:MAG TPA: adenine deaminase [Syntrophomonadaceae bacterium]|nr:adenine deaminase [Syntrophomonadaceae bacterium]
MNYHEMDYRNLRPVACGETEADLLLVNGRVFSVFTGEILWASVAIKGQYIAGVGDYHRGREVVDLNGAFLLPGFIDSHIHIESSMLTPAVFASTAVPHGTTAVLADPHEIVNVMGLEGWRYMVESSGELPLDFFWQIPSCVPATHMETSGGSIGPAEVDQALELFPQCPALAEMMNFPGVVLGMEPTLALIDKARQRGLLVEGHAPGLSGFLLNAYAASGCSSDHECSSIKEAQEKLRLGLRLLIREGSAAHNLVDLLPLVNERNYHRCCLCSDDRHPSDLLLEGHMDHILREAVAAGCPAYQAIAMATMNPAQHYDLKARGAIAPGCLADLVVVDNLRDFTIRQVYKQGRLVVDAGKYLMPATPEGNRGLTGSFVLPNIGGHLRLLPPASAQRVKIIEVIPGQILTRSISLPVEDAFNRPGVNRLAVVERHGRNGNIALGLVKGFDLQKGALASSVAHDSHNLIAVGKDEKSMEQAAERVAEMGGGMAVVDGDQVLASLALPVAGLMSPCPAAQVAAEYEDLQKAAQRLGCRLPSPFMTLSFLALPVIPELRLSDMGLVDVNAFELVDLWE